MPTGVGITGLGLGNLLRLVGLERTCPVLADLPTILDTFLPVGFLVPNFPLSSYTTGFIRISFYNFISTPNFTHS